MQIALVRFGLPAWAVELDKTHYYIYSASHDYPPNLSISIGGGKGIN